jgi:phage FluMu gp28-like protein
VFQQEYEAEFLDESAGVFRGIQACVKGTIEPSPISGHYYVIGVDLARIRDYTVLTVMDRQRKHVVNQERFTSLAWEVQYMRIRDIAARYNGALCVVDSTGIGDPICESLRAGGVAVEPYKIGSHIAKQQLIEKLRVSIEQGRISFPKIPAMLYELEIYEYNVTDAGVIRYSAPDGQHDDCVISLALATWVADADVWTYKYYQRKGI